MRILYCCRHTLCLFFVALSLAPVATAQTSGGSLRGYVTDDQKAAIPDVVLTATSPDAPSAYTASTDGQGFYRLIDVPPGTYSIKVERQGFVTVVRENIVMRAGTNLGLDFTLKVASVSEELTVQAETPLLESQSAVQAVNVSGDLQRGLPLSGRRNWADALLLVPGVSSTETSNNTQILAVHGSDFSANTLRIDGADVASTIQGHPGYVQLSTEAIQDVQVRVGGADASAPLGSGGALIVTTKSGTNDLKGSAAVVYRSRSWNGNNVTGGTAANVRLLQPDLSLGGPIQKDRWWFFGAYRRINAATAVARTSSQLTALQALVPGFRPFDLENKANVSFLKTSIAVAPSHQLTAFYQRDVNPTAAAGGDLASASRIVMGGNAASARVRSTWGSRLTTDVGVGYNDKGTETILTNAGEPIHIVYQMTALSGGRLTGSGRLAAYGASSSLGGGASGRKITFSADATYFRQGWFGSHQVQAGLFVQPRDGYRSFNHYANGGAALEDLVLKDPQNISGGTRVFHKLIYDVPDLDSGLLQASDTAVYVQDLWTPVRRLTATAGVRVDVIRKRDGLFDLQTQRSVDTGPRLGLNYALTADRRKIVRAGWSRVHETVAQNQFSLGTNSPGLRDLYDADGDGVFETTFTTAASTVLNPALIVDPNALHQPYVDEWNAGYRWQLPGQVAVDASVVNREFRHRLTNVDTNGIYDGVVFLGYRNEAQNEIYSIQNNVWNWNVMREINLTVTKDASRLQLIASYSRQWRHIAGTWQPRDPAALIQPDAFRDTRGIGQQNNRAAGSNSLSGTALAENQGPSNQWRDHMGRIGLASTLPWDLQLAVHYVVESGPWSGPVVTRIAAADPRFGPSQLRLSNGRLVSNPLATTFRFVGATRSEGQFELATYHTFNVRVGRSFSIRRSRFDVSLEGFNLSNNGATLQLAASGNQMNTLNFRQGINVQLPRSGQLSARWVF